MNPVIRSIDQAIVSRDLLRWYDLGYNLGRMGADLDMSGTFSRLPDLASLLARIDAMTRGHKRGVAEREAKEHLEGSEQC
jgi:hypothetical protein